MLLGVIQTPTELCFFRVSNRINGSNRATVSIYNNSHFIVSILFQHNSVYNTNHHTIYHQSPSSVANFAKTGCVITTYYMQACDSSTICTGPSLLVVTTSPPPPPPPPIPPPPPPTPLVARTSHR